MIVWPSTHFDRGHLGQRHGNAVGRVDGQPADGLGDVSRLLVERATMSNRRSPS